MKILGNDGRKFSRHLMVVAGVAVLLWSGLEDNDAITVTTLGVLMATSLSTMLMTSRLAGATLRKIGVIERSVIAGLLTGALSSLTTPLLMLFKDVRHAHVFPDYPPQMMLAMLDRLPYWTIAGGLIGIGIGILLKLLAQRRYKR